MGFGSIAGTLSGMLSYGVVDRSRAREYTGPTTAEETEGNAWTIEHNMGTYPAVTVVDELGYLVLVDVLYNNENSLTVLFDDEFSGAVYLN